MAKNIDQQPQIGKTAMEIALEEARQKNEDWKPEETVDKIEPPTEEFVGPPKPERTPAEERSFLRKLIMGATEKFNWYKSSEEHLIRRNEELDAQLEKVGGVEKGFRWIGEKYNKLGWKSKLGIGVALGLGAGIAAPVNMAVAAGFLSGIAAQRIAGLATMYLKFEKNSHGEKYGKEKAMAKAILYAATMTAGTMYAVKEIADTDIYHRTQEWLGSMFGHNEVPNAPDEAPQAAATVTPAAGVPTTAPDAVPVSATTATAESSATPLPVETSTPMPTIEATPGKGYEYMMKRMWEQLQEKGLDPSTYPEGSDIRLLIEATPSNIDNVVHNIAADPGHGFFKLDGTSVRIDLGSQMTINTEGNIQLGEVVKAPEGAPVTPVYPQPEAVAAQPAEAVNYPNLPEDSDINAVPAEVDDEAVPAVAEPLQKDTVETPPETSVATEVVRNSTGLEIPITQPHIYAGDGNRLFVFGGTLIERANAIQEFLKENPNKVVFASDDTGKFRLAWHLVGGKAEVAGAPMRTTGFLGFGSTWMKPPNSEDLQKLVK